jgi:hypothetical protein
MRSRCALRSVACRTRVDWIVATLIALLGLRPLSELLARPRVSAARAGGVERLFRVVVTWLRHV